MQLWGNTQQVIITCSAWLSRRPHRVGGRWEDGGWNDLLAWEHRLDKACAQDTEYNPSHCMQEHAMLLADCLALTCRVSIQRCDGFTPHHLAS